jgi:hypothetical protein
MSFSFSSSVDSGSNISDDPHEGIINRIIIILLLSFSYYYKFKHFTLIVNLNKLIYNLSFNRCVTLFVDIPSRILTVVHLFQPRFAVFFPLIRWTPCGVRRQSLLSHSIAFPNSHLRSIAVCIWLLSLTLSLPSSTPHRYRPVPTTALAL